MRVLFTRMAERQVGRLHGRIAELAGEARADAYVGRIITFCLGLTTFPSRGAPRDDVLPGLRVVALERRTLIAYIVTADAVVIQGVLHGGQDLAGALGNPTPA